MVNLISQMKSKCINCSTLPENDMQSCNNCMIKTIAYQRYWEANIPVEYWELSMEKNFSGSQSLMDWYKENLDVDSFYTKGNGVCLAGQHGTGKTMTLSCLLKRASHKTYNCLYTTLSDMVAVLTSNNYDDRSDARRELLLTDFLFIDEFDSRFFAQGNSSELFGKILENILRTRSQNQIPTLFASNSPDPINGFNGALKQSLSSLFNGYIQIVPILGKDFRKQ